MSLMTSLICRGRNAVADFFLPLPTTPPFNKFQYVATENIIANPKLFQ